MSVTGWVLIWVALVVLALVFYTLIGVHLFKKARIVLTQVSRSAEVFEQFNQAMQDAEQAPYTSHHAIGASPETRNEWRHARRVNRVRRSKRKALRHERTLQRWREIPFPGSNA